MTNIFNFALYLIRTKLAQKVVLYKIDAQEDSKEIVSICDAVLNLPSFNVHIFM